MPIKPELRYLYGKEWRFSVRPRILARAGDKCEQCGVPNQVDVLRIDGNWTRLFTRPVLNIWHDVAGQVLRKRPEPGLRGARTVRIILTIAHLNHVSGDDRDENLKALCQWCHLNYDKLHHHETRATRKDASRPLLAEQLGSELATATPSGGSV